MPLGFDSIHGLKVGRHDFLNPKHAREVEQLAVVKPTPLFAEAERFDGDIYSNFTAELETVRYGTGCAVDLQGQRIDMLQFESRFEGSFVEAINGGGYR